MPLGEDLAHLLAADPLLHPPIGIVGLVDVREGHAGTGEIVELPFFDRRADAVLGDELGDAGGKAAVGVHGEIMPDPKNLPECSSRCRISAAIWCSALRSVALTWGSSSARRGSGSTPWTLIKVRMSVS